MTHKGGELSADLGEGAEDEEEVWTLIEAANVACGGHTGDPASMRAAIATAQTRGVLLGAHPSYPDREHFGRRSMQLEPAILRSSLRDQIESLRGLAAEAGMTVERVKPHGALYNDAHRDESVARLVVDVIRTLDETLALVCGSESAMAAAAGDAGVRVVREAFADRRYESDGSLVSRSIAGSLLSIEESATQARSLVSVGMVTARNGARISVAFDTICVHADLESAAARLRAIREVLHGG